MTSEEKYAAQLRELGVYRPAFDAEIHLLCILEREHHRAMKAWKATAAPGEAPSPLDPHYALIQQQRRDILSHRDALGLTPKGLRRLQRGSAAGESAGSVQTASPVMTELLAGLRAQAEANADVSGSDTGGDA